MLPGRPLLSGIPPPPHTPSGEGGGGVRNPENSLWTSVRAPIPGLFDEFRFFLEGNCSDVGGWVGRGWAGPQMTPPQSFPEKGGEGVLEPKSPKVCVPKKAQINISFCKFHFFPL